MDLDRKLKDSVVKSVFASFRREIAEEKNKLNIIVQNMSDGLIVIDQRGEVELINSAAKTILGWEGRDVLPTGFKKFIINEFKSELLKHNVKHRFKEIRLTKPKRAYIQASISKVEYKKSNKQFFILVLRDITLAKKVDKIKSTIISDVSHEIKTPLLPIKNSIELILERDTSNMTGEQVGFLKIAGRNIDRLIRMVNNLLDISRIETGTFQLILTETNIHDLINEVTDTALFYARVKNVKPVIKIGKNLPKLTCDRDRIIQVIFNLVSNAIKFSNDNSKIFINAIKGKKDILVKIRDLGIGIKKGQAAKIFKRFKQVGVYKNLGGSGLGLAVSKEIIKRHGGKIGVKSSFGRGSTFYFSLPIQRKVGQYKRHNL